MYDNFLFSKKTFMAWKDDKNPKEQEGKGETRKIDNIEELNLK